MPKFKNIRIKKPGGGTRMQRVQVLASGKYKFVKNKTRSKSRGNPRRNPTKRRNVNMARRRRNSRKRHNSNGMGNGLQKVFSLTRKLAPRLAAHSGVPYMGYDITAKGLPIGERIQRFAANELLISTGVDIKAGKPGLHWNATPLMVQMLANINPAQKVSSIVNKIVKGI